MDTLSRQFGLVIAYLLPGFVALAGIAPLSAIVAKWLYADQTVSFGAPVYALLAATAAGMVVSCFRWFVVDRIHILTGVAAPVFNARALEDRPAAFNLLVESHYRYYQFYANTLVAVVWTYAIYRLLVKSSHLALGTDIGVLILCAVLFAGSRDALSKYRNRSGQLVGQLILNKSEGEPMTNGIDHNQGNGDKSEKQSTPPKPAAKPEIPAKPQSAPSSAKQTK
jgi:hypothetical protein